MAESRVFSVPFNHSGPLPIRKDLDQGEDFNSEVRKIVLIPFR